jgi:hypothetical protein
LEAAYMGVEQNAKFLVSVSTNAQDAAGRGTTQEHGSRVMRVGVWFSSMFACVCVRVGGGGLYLPRELACVCATRQQVRLTS